MARERGVAKKAKDPNAPKRALSAYFIWLQENRPAIKKDGMSVSDVAKAAGKCLNVFGLGHVIIYNFFRGTMERNVRKWKG